MVVMITTSISTMKTNTEACRNATWSTRKPPTEGPANAPAEYRDVQRPETIAYVSRLSGNPPLSIAEIENSS